MDIIEYFYDSPIGVIFIKSCDGAIIYVGFDDDAKPSTSSAPCGAIRTCVTQLDEYFAGRRKVFDVPLSMELGGTVFRKSVWVALLSIPYGQTRTYKDIAAAVGNVRAVRAVGGANNKNPISIIIPCHRVIGMDGGLTGYGGSLWRKEWLLRHENALKTDI